MTMTPTRRQFLRASAAVAAWASAPAFVRDARAAGEFRIGMFYAIAGPAAGCSGRRRKPAPSWPPRRSTSGGILGRQIKLIFADAGGPAAEASKSAVRLMLEEKVDFFIGSHDSATREATGRDDQGQGALHLHAGLRRRRVRRQHLRAGRDAAAADAAGGRPGSRRRPASRRVLPDRRRLRLAAQGQRAGQEVSSRQYGGKVVGEEYVPFGAPNKFEEAVTRIKGAKPDIVLITLVGADNVNFNRTFAGFGLDKEIARLSLLLEENTLLGIGAERQRKPLLVHGRTTPTARPGEHRVQGGLHGQVRRQGAETRPDRRRLLLRGEVHPGGGDAGQGHAGRQGRGGRPRAVVRHPHRPHDDVNNRHVDKNMYLAECRGTEFQVVETFKNVKSGQTCA